VFAEEYLASNVETLRLARGWTYEGLARRMSDIGCPIDQSAIYKIEKGRPRRRITVDELVGFSRVFGRSLEHMIADPALHASEDAIAAAEEWFRVAGKHILVNQEQERERKSLEDRLVRATAGSPEAREAVMSYLPPGTGKTFAIVEWLNEQLRSRPEEGSNDEHREKA
jgi:transcriptional regulator with XRE-family HTH domain